MGTDEKKTASAGRANSLNLAILAELGVATAGSNGKIESAAAHYLKAAEEGDSRAMAKLAQLYKTGGPGVQKSDAQAEEWRKRALSAGGASDVVRSRKEQRLIRKARKSQRICVISSDGKSSNDLLAPLEEAGYTTLHLDNPKLVLERVKDMGQVCSVIIDLDMPSINGFNVIATIKSSHQGNVPSFILVAGNVTRDHVSQGKSAGVERWLVKPAKKTILTSMVDQICLPK